MQDPRAYIETYAEKWLERGYDEESLSCLASLGMKMGYGFPELDTLLDTLYTRGIVDGPGVKNYCAARERQLRLLQRIQSVCGVIRKTSSALDMLEAWRSWDFSEDMIMEAAKRSAGASSPLPYMNKLLSEWKREGIFSPAAIPAHTAPKAQETVREFKTEAAISADARTERERYYAPLRRRAAARAEQAKAEAEKDAEFSEAERAIKKGEIELAKAEVFAPETMPSLMKALNEAKKRRAAAMVRLGFTEQDFVPQYACKKCSDTGFLPDGRMCDCYKD